MTPSEDQSTGSSVTARLIGLITALSNDEQGELLRKLEEGLLGEKRTHAREPCTISVEYGTSDNAMSGSLQNMSVNGLLLQTDEIDAFSFGQRVHLRISYPNRRSYLQITGKVVRIDSQGIGVTFSK